jgi:hypothetical protein
MKIFSLEFPRVLKFCQAPCGGPERASQSQRYGCSAMPQHNLSSKHDLLTLALDIDIIAHID